MRLKILVPAAIILGFVFWMIFDSAGDAKLDADAQALLDRKRQQSVEARSLSSPAIDADQLAELSSRGIGQPLPRDLRMEFVEGESPHWLVTKGGSKSEVKIPFIPGAMVQAEPPLEVPSGNPGFLGSAACASCHEKKHASFVKTPHHLTSRPATKNAFAGGFEAGSNVVRTSNPDLSFQLSERDGEFFQQFRFFDWQCEVPMDVVTGTAKMGQSFLYWNEDGLYQTNVSYVPGKGGWVNSPGFPDGNATYERPITARCLDCHITYVDYIEPPNYYARDSMIMGISCERCHGPGKEHVEHHNENPNLEKGEHISLPSDLSRKQQLDLCGQCHAGLFPLRGNPFSFRPGDTLTEHYIEIAEGAGDGVHTSDQLERLARSACFIESTMTCIDCHNPHQMESGQKQVFSERCIECHEPQGCGMSDQLGPTIADNCIDCHMPMYESKALRLQTSDRSSALMLRDHHIRVDEESTRIYLDSRADEP